MKKLLAVVLVAWSTSALTQHTSDFLKGEWVSNNPERGPEVELVSSKADLDKPKMKLTIKEGQATLLHRINKEAELTYFSPKGMEIFQELVILNFEAAKGGNGARGKLVLSGWRSISGTKIVFGYFYLFEEGKEHPFNGWPVDFAVK